jgi:cytoskeleton protein RodZ
MSTVTELLQRARLDQGIELATVAAHTKINAKYLQAIEADDRKSLPGGFFYKSFAHQYAAFLGLDTRTFDAEIDRELSEDAPLPSLKLTKQRALKSWSWTPGKSLSYAALAVILVACFVADGWWHDSLKVATSKIETRPPVLESTTQQRAPSAVTGQVSLAVVPHVAAGPTAATLVVAPAKQGEPADSRVELALTATEETWLSASLDGTPVFSGFLEANQTKTIEGKESAELRVGNAAGLEVRLNGKQLGPLGAHGQVRNMAFTSDKFQFVSSPNEAIKN